MTNPSNGGEPAPRLASLHERIRSSIEDQILSGALRPGDRIPFEHQLMAEFGCSRMTVSKAIAELANAGLVVRRRRAGSFVAAPALHSAVLEIPDIQAEVERRGRSYGYRLLRRSVRKPGRRKLEEVEVASGGRIVDLQCLHSAGSRPFALEERLISLDAAPDAEHADFSRTPPGAWLLEHVPWTEAEHRIAAIGANSEAATLLDIPLGAPCLLLERRTWRDGIGVTHVRQVFPGHSYDLIASFTPMRTRER